MYVVLVTGSRTWENREKVHAELSALADVHGPLLVRHGKASRGADLHAAAWAYSYRDMYPGSKEDPMPADWNGLGKRAGMARNQEMVNKDPRPEEWLGFMMFCRDPKCTREVLHETHGAADCARRAELAGIPGRRIYD